ncbi:MAG: hypothetical protein Q9166_005348 [cf. Caloplaca sp. 2 TL-2023]
MAFDPDETKDNVRQYFKENNDTRRMAAVTKYPQSAAPNHATTPGDGAPSGDLPFRRIEWRQLPPPHLLFEPSDAANNPFSFLYNAAASPPISYTSYAHAVPRTPIPQFQLPETPGMPVPMSPYVMPSHQEAMAVQEQQQGFGKRQVQWQPLQTSPLGSCSDSLPQPTTQRSMSLPAVTVKPSQNQNKGKENPITRPVPPKARRSSAPGAYNRFSEKVKLARKRKKNAWKKELTLREDYYEGEQQALFSAHGSPQYAERTEPIKEEDKPVKQEKVDDE